MRYVSAFFLLAIWTCTFGGCGSGYSHSSATTSNPNPSPSPNPSPAPNPTPNPSAVQGSYLATIICCSVGKSESAEGQITVDAAANNGAGNIQITNDGGNIAANQNLTLQFCPYPQNYMNCTNVASLSTDSNGKANANFTIPQKGTLAGAFQITNATDGSQYLVTASASNGAANFKSAELPAASITGGINHTTGNAPGNGNVTVTGTTAHLALSGTYTSHAFQISACGINGSCTVLTTVASDAQGNVSADMMLPQFDSVLFLVYEQTGEVDFISAFQVE